MMDYAECFVLAEKSLSTAGAKAALHDWEGAEKAAVAALAFVFDFKLAIIEHAGKSVSAPSQP